jgi:DNA-3-methyladenine glycosylase II
VVAVEGGAPAIPGETLWTFEVGLQGPLDVAGSVERFRRWGDDLLDRWDGQTLVRTTKAGGLAVPYACRVVGTIEQPRLAVSIIDPGHQAAVERAIREMLVEAPAGALATLASADLAVGRLVVRHPGIRPALQADGLTAIIRSISSQQVNLTWAATTRRRLAEAFGERHQLGDQLVYSFAPARLATAGVPALRALKFTTRKAEYIVALARSVAEGALDLEALASLPDAEVVERLTTRRGIGRWTAEWYLARTLGRPVVVAGDLGVRKAVGLAYLDGAMPSEDETRALTAHWGAAACVAQELALYDMNQRGRAPAAQGPTSASSRPAQPDEPAGSR